MVVESKSDFETPANLYLPGAQWRALVCIISESRHQMDLKEPTSQWAS